MIDDAGAPPEDPGITRDELAAAYAFPDPVPDDGWVRATMISSVDGAATGADGRSGSLGTPADALLLSTLRGLADVVLVAAGTVRDEGYLLPEPVPELAGLRAGLGQPPVASMAVVTGSGVLPEPLLADAARRLRDHVSGRLLVLTGTGADPDALADAERAVPGCVHVLDTDSAGWVDLAAAVALLVRLGLARVQCEGGPSLLAQAYRAGVVDELSLTVAPVIAGGASGRIVGPTAPSTRLRLAGVIPVGDTLFTRWRS